MQVFFKRGFAAHGHWFGLGHYRLVVQTVRRGIQPCAVGLTEVIHQPLLFPRSELAYGVYAVRL